MLHHREVGGKTGTVWRSSRIGWKKKGPHGSGPFAFLHPASADLDVVDVGDVANIDVAAKEMLKPLIERSY